MKKLKLCLGAIFLAVIFGLQLTNPIAILAINLSKNYIVFGYETDAIEALFNNNADGNQYYVKETTILYSLDENPSYLLAEFEPYGFAIMLRNRNELMQFTYQKDSHSIFYGKEGKKYFAGGINCYIKLNNTMKNLYNGKDVTEKELNELIKKENFISNYYNSTNSTTNTIVGGTEYYINNHNYFRNLNDYGNNNDGTCTVVATAITLGYYNYYKIPNLIDSIYIVGQGTNQAFHNLLQNNYVTSRDNIGIFNGLKQYFYDKGYTNGKIVVSNQFSSLFSYVNLKHQLNNDIPTIIGTTVSSAGHAAVAYGYRENYDGSIYILSHYGLEYGNQMWDNLVMTTGAMIIHYNEFFSSIDDSMHSEICDCGYAFKSTGHTFNFFPSFEGRPALNYAPFHRKFCNDCDYSILLAHNFVYNFTSKICTDCGFSTEISDPRPYPTNKVQEKTK